ncbi:hypothetical protein GMOD_00009432 [Pyrenophora seminiperda CCB06]|uniref:Uncharacterized protein n=1 Tax=Pyrenophora seminiperda CCB06 TaxID=1302712 RepID=A0A3M7MH68_9PLEO|nr:hypothetical protein GMOD_00009432 [Pyrenophora seminiperda CCB06]
MDNILSILRNEGVPALAYPADDVSILQPYSLRILLSDAQFMLSLEHSILVPGLDDKQTFTLRYEGDNIMPGKGSLGNVGDSLPHGSLDIIARHKQPQPRMLSLTLKSPCSVWYPHNLGNRVSSLDTCFHKLLTLAKATEIRILFDSKWATKQNLARLQGVVKGSRRLTGLPVLPQFARLYQQADWSILNSILDAKSKPPIIAPPPIENAVNDAPPPYAHVPSKRSRNTRSSLTPDSPLPKRLLLDAAARSPSPTDDAKSTISSTSTVEVDLFQDLVAAAVEKLLPDMLRAQLPSILQDVLPEMLACPSSPSSWSSQRANTSPQQHHDHKPLTTTTTLAHTIKQVISTHTKLHIRSLLTKTLDHAGELQDRASNEIDDRLDEARTSFAALKEDHMFEVNELCNEKLVEFREHLAEEKDRVEEAFEGHAEEVLCRTWDGLDAVKRAVCCSCAKDKEKSEEWGQYGRRARSLPL